jgi:hypothetical protein
MIGANETEKTRIAKFGYSDDPNNRIFGYSVIRLFGYSVIRLFGYSVIRLFGYSVIRSSEKPNIRLFGYSVIRVIRRKPKKTEFGDNRPKPFGSLTKTWNRDPGNFASLKKKTEFSNNLNAI